MIHEIQHTAQQHNNNSSISEGYGMSQNHHFECPQATFDSSCFVFELIIYKTLDLQSENKRKQ